MNYLEMNDVEIQECLNYADIELIKKGHITNDISNYMENTPAASVALRKAKELNYSNDDWKEILKSIDKR